MASDIFTSSFWKVNLSSVESGEPRSRSKSDNGVSNSTLAAIIIAGNPFSTEASNANAITGNEVMSDFKRHREYCGRIFTLTYLR